MPESPSQRKSSELMPLNPDVERYEREQRFHDDRFEEEMRVTAGKYYTTTRASQDVYNAALRDLPTGARTLELGCGVKTSAFGLATRGIHALAIDISPVAIEQAREEAARRGIDGAEFKVMNAEDLDFPEGQFDLVHGCGVLHHLNLESAMSEIQRVLKPGGRMLFIEPMGHNPFIRLYRRMTPNMRTEDEHPLMMKDLKEMRRRFPSISFRFYHLFSLLAVPFMKTRMAKPLLSISERVDSFVLRLPFVRRLAWMVVIEAED